MDLPRITVVTPTYNRTEYLEETINSVLSQDYPNLEYIIVDGGSTNPEVLRLIRRYEDKLAWWVSEPDRGHAEAIRKGFDRATGEILAWLCSDDTYLPGALLTVGQAFRQHPEADVIYGHANIVDSQSRVTRNARAVRFHPLQLLSNGNIHQASVFWTKEIYHRAGGHVGGYNLEYVKYSPDSDLFYRLIRAGANWVFLPRPLSTFRVHPEQPTTREKNIVKAYWWKAARENYPFWTRPGVFPLVRAATRMRRLVLLLAQGDARYLWAKFTKRIYHD